MAENNSGNLELNGGQGEFAREPQILSDGDRGHERASLRTLQRAVLNGWNIPQEWLDSLPEVAAQIARSGKSDRDRLRALEVLKSMADSRVAAAVALDKIERLDSGKATEIHKTFQLEFDS